MSMNSERNDEVAEDGLNATDSPEALDAMRAAAAPIEQTTGAFDRAMAPSFMEKLQAEAGAGGWWRDILNDKDLVIAPRGNSLDVYWSGARLFHVSFARGVLSVSTHEKYLLDPRLNSQIPLVAGRFAIGELSRKGFIENYEGSVTIELMKRAAAPYRQAEKIGCHAIAIRNSAVIDREIAFPGAAGQVDLASLENSRNEIRLVFWEAKLFSNADLRAALPALARVHEQIARYRAYLSAHRDDIIKSYTSVAKNLVAFKEMGWCRELSSLICDVASGRRTLVMGETPSVGLLIFGFDQAQRDDANWQIHLKRLAPPDIDRVIARQEAQDIIL
jgi:hypothetical protein